MTEDRQDRTPQKSTESVVSLNPSIRVYSREYMVTSFSYSAFSIRTSQCFEDFLSD